MSDVRSDATDEPIWRPSESRIEGARLTHYLQWLNDRRSLRFDSYEDLWRWSVTDLDEFWRSVWEYFDVRSPTPFACVITERRMPGARWFPGATVNFVDQVFRHRDVSRPAIIFCDETGEREEISWSDLEERVASVAAFLRRSGVTPGDRVVAYLPNRPEAVVAFLACAAVGAVWSLCSPETGAASVLDRFAQIHPKVLIVCEEYRYGGKIRDRRDAVEDLLRGLPSVQQVIRTGARTAADNSPVQHVAWEDIASERHELKFSWVPFDHPLWIVYSSGTTGIPKALVHGHGGIVLAMSAALAFHNDLGPQDRFHWYSSSGWVMWNCQIGGLLVGSTICIYDGNPGYPDLRQLWRFAADAKVTFFGAGAAFYGTCMKNGIEPGATLDLSSLRSVGSTGSPLSPECYQWIYQHVRSDAWLAPMSGGTDIAGPFVGGNPTAPVYVGEMQCRVLGAAVYAFDGAGAPVVDEVGELVCTEPMPSMPLFFWEDVGGERYQSSYFDVYPGVWRHGDWIRITPRGGAIIYGRSDATINRQGVRMGTSELYRAVESIPDILDCLVVDLEYLGRQTYMPLFVVLKPRAQLTQELKNRISASIRETVSPRMVPDEIIAVNEVPRTVSGKRLEVPIKKLLLGHKLRDVVNRDSVMNPESLTWFAEFAARVADRRSGAP